MRRVIRVFVRVIVVLVVLVAALALWKREEIKRLLVVNSLFDAEKIVANFSSMEAAFLKTDLPKGDGATYVFPKGEPIALPDGADQWIKDRSVTSLLVLKDGALRYEEYFLGTTAEDRRISWSVAKSYLSALFGVVLAEGAIASIDDPVIKYAPELAESAYRDATVRNVLNMASGVEFDEDYLDFNSDINRMGRVLALGQKMDDFTASIDSSFAPPGVAWQYVSIDTHVIGMVIRGATGRPIAELLSEKILAPLGMEQDGYYVTDGVGVAFVLGGLNFTTRDYARFGQMIANDGAFNGTQIVPADWIAASTTPSAPTDPGNQQYGFQWWMPEDARPGEYFARGIYGQYIYIDHPRNIVIVTNGADRGFRNAGVNSSNIEMFRAIAENL
ncbi:serine hydrolase domain-containing protein [Cognatishimia sp.]|uniref:serine hydrolase domain-containing protein n=1 Tax=Cognatishimia sp. TaxID=2211648 RepID=UPI00351670BE